MSFFPEFLITTRYCEADHREIRGLARQLTQACQSDVEKAVTLFHWVRDQIEYRLGLHKHTASETLAHQWGSCSNKANLLVALMRALGIPAGFHLLEVKTREYFGPLTLPAFCPFVSHRSLHVFCALYLQGQWVRCDPTDDARLSESTLHLSPQSRKVEFDGTRDAMLNLTPEHILSDDGALLPHIDHVFAKERRSLPIFLAIAQFYMDFLRSRGKEFSNVDDLQECFLRLLEKEFPEAHGLILEAAHLDRMERLAG